MSLCFCYIYFFTVLAIYKCFSCCVILMILRPPTSTRTDTLFPYTTLFRSPFCSLRADKGRPKGRHYNRTDSTPTASIQSSMNAAVNFPRLSLRSEEHTSELQSLMRISYAVFCLNKKKQYTNRLILSI